jgi:hypothetical protein
VRVVAVRAVNIPIDSTTNITKFIEYIFLSRQLVQNKV